MNNANPSRTAWFADQKLPKITRSQEAILVYLALFRFLSSTQIQKLLGHKDKRRVNEWLRDLMAKHYIEGTYTQSIWHINQPAVYHLSLVGIRYLKTLHETTPDVLARFYRDNTRSKDFIAKCLTTADIAIQLVDATTDDDGYDFVTFSDYADPSSRMHFLLESPIAPDLVVIKRTRTYHQPYLIEVMTASQLPYQVRAHVDRYVQFHASGTWEELASTDFPPVIFVCADRYQLTLVKHFAKRIQSATPDASDIRLDFMTVGDIQGPGIVPTLKQFEP